MSDATVLKLYFQSAILWVSQVLNELSICCCKVEVQLCLIKSYIWDKARVLQCAINCPNLF